MSLTGPVERFERKGVDYVVRPYEDGDRDGFLDVYATVTDLRLDAEWFDATYEAVPHLDHVPVVVVETGDTVVGLCPFGPLPIRGGSDEREETALALLSRDVVVHPDHRRRGLYTAALEYALACYADHPAAFVVAPSVVESRAANERLGWTYGPPRKTHYRVRDATAFVAHRLGPRRRFAAPLPGAALDAYVVARDRRHRDACRVEVTRTDGLAVDILVDLHTRPSGRPAAVSQRSTPRRSGTSSETRSSRDSRRTSPASAARSSRLSPFIHAGTTGRIGSLSFTSRRSPAATAGEERSRPSCAVLSATRRRSTPTALPFPSPSRCSPRTGSSRIDTHRCRSWNRHGSDSAVGHSETPAGPWAESRSSATTSGRSSGDAAASHVRRTSRPRRSDCG
ncbi:hypothetical protein C2R22_08245 [Salinigranum rubrum]|uniref:N-acetyltransferase domain-containing protein n=1 Tax=Salinigranum rubrum TaxID=755307 RepID=A0A2I8VIA5_9EURY|nr:GNAT family N-acetyltransferase [Salinigranum rubrum]AUV81645.1 hypothetical protein C2R22_08245 [Salinigranum rubrum]